MYYSVCKNFYTPLTFKNPYIFIYNINYLLFIIYYLLIV